MRNKKKCTALARGYNFECEQGFSRHISIWSKALFSSNFSNKKVCNRYFPPHLTCVDRKGNETWINTAPTSHQNRPRHSNARTLVLPEVTVTMTRCMKSYQASA